MNIYIILLAVLIFFLFNYVINNGEQIKENFGSSFFHRSFLSGLGQEQRQAGLKKLYDFYGLKKEGFEVEKKDKEIEQSKQVNPNVISELPKNEVKNEFVLEDFKFDDQKHIQSDDLELADYLEVDKYDSGSGDLNKLKDVFEESTKKTFKESVELLKKRGGNVH